jgi:alpha-beta hydrolase superfamily lysophospholipase
MTKSFHAKRITLRTVLLTALVFVLVFSTGSLIFINSLYQQHFPRFDKGPYSGRLEFGDVPAYAPSVVKFPSGKNKLTGYILGEENTKGLVVVAPGVGEGTEHYLPEMMYFVDRGWRVFAFEYTGSFASEGENSVGLPQSRVDLEAALAYIQSNSTLNHLPVMLWGHSWGGYAVAAVLRDHPDISAVATLSGFNSPMGLLDEQVRQEAGVLGYVEYPFGWIYQTVRFGRSAGVTAVDGINAGDTPVMIVHGSADEAISYDGASIIAQREQITNPNVVYKTCSAKNQNGHRNLLWSDAAVQYIDQKNQEYRALLERYDGSVPERVLADFYASVDRFRTSEMNAGLVEEIDRFFESALLDSAGE